MVLQDTNELCPGGGFQNWHQSDYCTHTTKAAVSSHHQVCRSPLSAVIIGSAGRPNPARLGPVTAPNFFGLLAGKFGTSSSHKLQKPPNNGKELAGIQLVCRL